MRSTLEKALIALLSEDKDQAAALFHEFLIGRSRQINESLVQGEEFVLNESVERAHMVDSMFTESDLEGFGVEVEEVDEADEGHVAKIRDDGWFSISMDHMLSPEECAAYDEQLAALGYHVGQDYEWSIAGGDDAPDGISIESMAMRQDPQVLNVLGELYGPGAYDTSDFPAPEVDEATERQFPFDTGSGGAATNFDEARQEGLEDYQAGVEHNPYDPDTQIDLFNGYESGQEAGRDEDDESWMESASAEDDLLESLIDDLEKVAVDGKEGATTSGEKVKVNKASPALQPKIADRAFKGTPVKVTGDEHSGFNAEKAPKVAQMPKRQNTK